MMIKRLLLFVCWTTLKKHYFPTQTIFNLMNLLNLSYYGSDEEDAEGCSDKASPPRFPNEKNHKDDLNQVEDREKESFNKEFDKGNKALYMNTDECEIIEKHMDDYPNLYYTIKILKDGKERQTTQDKLYPILSCNDELDVLKFPHLSGFPAVLLSDDKELIAKLENYQKMKVEKKYSLIQEFRTKKDFGNPQFLQKMIAEHKINEISSNYPKEMYDPHGYTEFDFEESIRRRCTYIDQNTVYIDQNIENVSNTSVSDECSININRKDSENNLNKGVKRKSRWDQQQDNNTTPIY